MLGMQIRSGHLCTVHEVKVCQKIKVGWPCFGFQGIVFNNFVGLSFTLTIFVSYPPLLFMLHCLSDRQ